MPRKPLKLALKKWEGHIRLEADLAAAVLAGAKSGDRPIVSEIRRALRAYYLANARAA